MRGLSGDFSTMPLKDLVAYLGNRRVTGTLRVLRAGVRKLLLVREGQVLSASSNQPREYLGQFLMHMGHLSEEDFQRAHARQREAQVPLGQMLVAAGTVSEQTVRGTLQLKFREGLLEMFRWEEGEFSFDAGAVAEVEGIEARVDLLDIHREGEFRETAWQAIKAVFPSGAAYLEVDEGRLAEPPRPGTLDAALVARVREGLSIDELVRVLHASDFLVYQRLYALHRQEALRVVNTPPPGRSPPAAQEPLVAVPSMEVELSDELTTEELIQSARSALENGDFQQGEALARRAHERAATSETEALLHSAEAVLLGVLRRRMLDTPQVPSLRVTAAQLKTTPLTSPERYLLSRIDGKRDVRDILGMSPLHELDALRYFQSFVDMGLVRLTPR
ncbi:DUF4388 domain-containing protein [Melittangium boletus]|uniref:DUF4388 domain-containing protein n=1 Tax=Melittangium boletus TaxID=83453 RepID=UPI003DA5FFA7